MNVTYNSIWEKEFVSVGVQGPIEPDREDKRRIHQKSEQGNEGQKAVGNEGFRGGSIGVAVTGQFASNTCQERANVYVRPSTGA